jgi:type II secretion system protein G
MRFYNLQFTIYNCRKAAFTLVEILIVVAILGIIAAIVLPEFQGHIQQAKEAAAKDNLRILREAIERYAFDHDGVPPGYLNDDTSQTPSSMRIQVQLTYNKNYLTKLPENPFNNQFVIHPVEDNDPMSSALVGNFGWIYKPSTKTIKLNTDGVDSEGISYLDY